MSNLSALVTSNDNTLASMENRLDFECIPLKDVFSKGPVNNKLKFFFKKKFFKKPQVILTFKSLSMSQTVNSNNIYSMNLLVPADTVDQTGFSYSITQLKSKIEPTDPMTPSTLEICYIAFEDLR